MMMVGCRRTPVSCKFFLLLTAISLSGYYFWTIHPRIWDELVKGVRERVASPSVRRSHLDLETLPDLLRLNLDDSSLPLGLSGSEATPRPLVHEAVPTIVHLVWCPEQPLTFRPYMAIKSAIRALQPSSLILHTQFPRRVDRRYYHLWVYELEKDYPFFSNIRNSSHVKEICNGDIKLKRNAILNLLRDEGGIYVGINTWLLNLPPQRFVVDLEMGLLPESVEGYLILRKGFAKQDEDLDTLAQAVSEASRVERGNGCTDIDELTGANFHHINCLIVPETRFPQLLPKHIMERNDTFGSIARSIFYGTSKILRPEPSYEVLVPNIAHMVWMGNAPISFVFYLGVLSLLYVVEVDFVYVHGDRVPKGRYWGMLMDNPAVRKRLVHVNRPRPVRFYQNYYPSPRSLSLLSNFLRADILIKYGGFYSDGDAIWVKPFTREQRAYDAAASYDWVDWSRPFPETMNLGVSYAKRNAPFMRLWRDGMRKNYEKLVGYVGTRMPYKIWERHPETLLVDPHLQVMCFKLKCHPSWEADFHNEKKDHTTTGSLKHWRESVHAFHWTVPDPPELRNMSSLMAAEGIFADVGRLVLFKAGLIEKEIP